jgi:L-seryl-tRNA(Ser) seleniumtransferase
MILEELNLARAINATGNITVLGGTILDDEVLEAIKEAAKIYVDVPEAHIKAGALIASLVGSEAAYITAGCAAALALSTAACITKGNLEMMLRLPKTDGMANEVIIQRLHRTCYDHNLEITGAKLKVIGDERRTLPRELEEAINENTAAVAYFVFDPQEGVVPLEKVLEISHRRGVPVIVDAAGELPSKENLTRFVKMGSDLVLFSGGKDLGAPNDTGIILGRKHLVDICRRLGPHNYEVVNSETKIFLGRPMKVSKEDIFAVVAAVKKYLNTDHDQRIKNWDTIADLIVDGLSDCTGIKVVKVAPDSSLLRLGLAMHPRPAIIPRVEVNFLDEDKRAEEIVNKLRIGTPPIYAYVRNKKLYLSPQCLQDGEEKIIVARLRSLILGDRDLIRSEVLP